LEKGDEGGFYGALQMNLLYATTDISQTLSLMARENAYSPPFQGEG